LASNRNQFYVYSMNNKNEITYGRAIAFKTRENAELIKITVSGGGEIICTYDQKFMMRDGSYCEAINLKYMDSLMPLYRTYATRDGYEGIIQPINKSLDKYTHKLIARQFYGDIPKGMIIHHININLYDNKLHGNTAKHSDRFKSEDFKEQRIRKLKEKGFYDEKFYNVKKEVAINNITSYMCNNKEHFKEVVKKNAARGSLFFKNKNSNEVLKTKQKLGKIRKILMNIKNDNQELNEENYEIYRKNYYNFPLYSNYLNFLKETDLSSDDIINKKIDKSFNNHKVINIEKLSYTNDVYCLNVEEHHNFALSIGIFVHNCGMHLTKLKEKEINLEKLDDFIVNHIPSGFDVREKEHNYIKKTKLDKLKCKAYINMERARLSIGTLGGGELIATVSVISR